MAFFPAFGNGEGGRAGRNARPVGIHGVNALAVAAFGFHNASNIGAGFDFGFRRFHLADVGCVGVVHTGGNVGDGFVASVDAFGRKRYAARSEAVGFQIVGGGHFVSGAAVFVLSRGNDNVAARFNFVGRFRCRLVQLGNVDCIGIGCARRNIGDSVAAVVEAV